MNKFVNNKKSKKFILVLVLLILFNFMYPKNVKAAIGFDDLIALPAYIFYYVETGVLKILNDMFIPEENKEYRSETIEREESSDSGAGNTSYETTELRVTLTPENIIKGKFLIFDANIFKKIDNSAGYYDYSDNGVVKEGKVKLRELIAGWYYALRNFAIVGLLIVLVYVGIRMAISTVAQEKSKYKAMLKDWTVALCLLILMHYLMITILNVTTDITEALGTGPSTNQIGRITRNISGVLSEGFDEKGTWNDAYKYDEIDEEGNRTGNIINIWDAYALLVVLGAIVVYTIVFAIRYLKREFTIIFLILLGPVSCITYPIDKIGDGKAQAFDKWFHEFLYQVIIQPFHLLLYIVLVGSAIQLANTNILYSIVCFAVMGPAEKFIKEMFGINERLGSPLGDMMKFSAGKKALEMITKSRGSKGGSAPDNNHDNNTISTRDIDNNNLIGEQNGTNLGSGDETEETNQDAQLQATNEDANLEENEPAPIGDGEDDNADSSIGDNDSNGIGDGENNESGNSASSEGNNAGSQPGVLDRFRGRLNTRTVQKYGTTNKKKIWKRRLLKGTGKAIKGLGVLTVGMAATTTALATGNGKEALAALGATAGYFGRRSRKNNKRSSWSS